MTWLTEKKAFVLGATAKSPIVIVAAFHSAVLLDFAIRDATCFIDDATVPCVAAADVEDTNVTILCPCSDALLSSGLDPDNVLVLQQLLLFSVIGIICPLLGEWIDLTSNRKTWYAGLLATLIFCHLGIMIMGPNYLWVVGLVFTAGTTVFYEVVYVVRASYLPELEEDYRKVSKWPAYGFMASSVAQILVAGGLAGVFAGLAVNDGLTQARIAIIVAALWAIAFGVAAYLGFKSRPAKRVPAVGEKVTVLSLLGNVWASAKTVLQEFPQVKRFLLVHSFSSTAAYSTISLSTTYLVAQVQLDGSDLIIIGVLVVIIQFIGAGIYSLIHEKVPPKTLYFATCLLGSLVSVAAPAFVNQPGQVYASWGLGALYGLYFGFYYPCDQGVYATLTPETREAQFIGLYNLTGFLFRFAPNLQYLLIVQLTNSQVIAFSANVVYYAVASVLILFVDVDKGIEQAQGKLAHNVET